jgi:integral membrane protein
LRPSHGATRTARNLFGVTEVSVDDKTRTRLLVFRIFAWVTGVVLLALTVGMVLKYGFGDRTVVATIGPVHGFLYMGYIVATLMLAERLRWKPVRAVLVLLAGTIPIASFVAERKVTREVQAGPAYR